MTHDPLPNPAIQDGLCKLPVYQSYLKSPYLSLKHSSYFQVYDELFDKYRDKTLTFVEVGVLNGGSLFMWRDFFGDKARIIGIDLNPQATRWEKEGFEIYIGNQADPAFWDGFFAKVGKIDILLDDGGHTYEQQIVTAHHAIQHIQDGGLLVIEDTHTSYMGEFGYPCKRSFMEWSKTIIDSINSRSGLTPKTAKHYQDFIYAVRCFESIVCFEIRPSQCRPSTPTSNQGQTLAAVDLRHAQSEAKYVFALRSFMEKKLSALKNLSAAQRLANQAFNLIYGFLSRNRARKLKKYF